MPKFAIVKVIRETSCLHRLTRFGMVNCFLVREDDGHILVDTGLAGSARGIVAATREMGSSIRRIVLTHAHLDHVGALDEIVRQCPGVSVAISERESRLLRRDFSLDAGESGKKLIGFPGTKTMATILVKDGDHVGPLQAVACPGHTPGHTAFLDVRDGTLLAGDAFTTQTGVVAAGVFQFYFPFPWLFSWNKEQAAESAKKLRDLKPERLAVGHGRTVNLPGKAMDKAVELAFRQCGKRG